MFRILLLPESTVGFGWGEGCGGKEDGHALEPTHSACVTRAAPTPPFLESLVGMQGFNLVSVGPENANAATNSGP